MIQPQFSFSDQVSETSRGDKGFGSSDTSVSATDNTTTVENVVNADEDVNPWEFTNVDELLIWCKSRPDLVDDEFFADLLSNTIANRERRKLNENV